MPSISFVQQTGVNGNSAVSPYALACPSITVTAGSLLCLTVVSAYNNLGFRDLTVSDSKGNTWVPFTRYSNPGNSNGGVTCFCAFNAAAGATVVTSTTGWDGGGFAYQLLTLAEFIVPPTLIVHAYDATNVPFLPGVGGDINGPTQSLPGPGLMWSGCCIENNHTYLTPSAFTDLTEQSAGVAFNCSGYAINPQGAVSKRFNTVTAGSDNSLALISFLDSAGFAARPKPIGGRGASW